MSYRAAALLLAAFAALPSVAAAAARPAFAPLDVFGLEWASNPEISPDGARIAYVRRSFDVKTDARRGAIWLVDRDGSNHRPLAGGGRQPGEPALVPGRRPARLRRRGRRRRADPPALVQGTA